MKSCKEIKVQITYTEGYEKRFTEACLNRLRKKEEEEQGKIQQMSDRQLQESVKAG